MPDFHRDFRRVQTFLEDAAIVLASGVLLVMGLIIVASIIGKTVFLKPIPDELLMVGLLNVAVIVLPLAYVERHRGHITVTVTTDWMGLRARGVLRALGALAMGVFFGGIGYIVVRRMPEEIARGAYYDGVLQIPTWPMKAVFGAAIILFSLRLLLSMTEGIRTAVTGLEDAASNVPHEEV
ncbi:MAG: TRAP transporter small permease [Paracoccaceae bacterium]|jgi:TRAP-type C4-dicarboxylate transport system permease small subunit|nr:TRAP transporter small permease [Paracoccaceae bacterium]